MVKRLCLLVIIATFAIPAYAADIEPDKPGSELYETRRALGATTDFLEQLLYNMEVQYEQLQEMSKKTGIPLSDQYKHNIEATKEAIEFNKGFAKEYNWEWKPSRDWHSLPKLPNLPASP